MNSDYLEYVTECLDVLVITQTEGVLPDFLKESDYVHLLEQ